MTWWRQIVRRARADRELAQEIEAHIAERVDDLVDGGMSGADARRTALREFGNPARCLEDSRSVWLIPWLVSLGQDARYVLRTIRRQPVFSASVVLILTFGIGLVTALFTVFTARVLRPWPVPDPSSIVVINRRSHSGATDQILVRVADGRDFQGAFNERDTAASGNFLNRLRRGEVQPPPAPFASRAHPPAAFKLSDSYRFALPCGPGDIVPASELEERQWSDRDRGRVDHPDIRHIGQRYLPVSALTHVDRRELANVDLSLNGYDPAAGARHRLHLSVSRSRPVQRGNRHQNPGNDPRAHVCLTLFDQSFR